MSITSIVNDTVTSVSVVNALKPLPPTITNYSVGGLDDTALDPAGGQTVQINGTGFLAGATITFDGSAVAVVTYVNSNQLTFTSPAKSAGTYTIYVVNPDGGTAIYIPGIIYSVLPTWTTSAGTLGSYYETTSISNTVVASGDAPITYSLFSGSLPTGSTLYANGVITGTAPVDSSSTTYSFTIEAIDAQLQGSTRSFSLTINVDAVTWVSPANNTTYTSAVDSAIANVTLSATDAAGYAVSYSANALPTGLTLTGSNIAGTPTVIADSSTLLTATAATTNRTATRTINWSITVANDPYFEYNTLLIPGASTTFVDDASTNNFAVSIFGDTKPNNFNPYTPGYYSGYFDGTGDYLTCVGSGAVVRASGSFTIEGWYYPTSASASYRAVYSSGSGYATAGRLYQYGTQLEFYNSGSGSAAVGSIGWTINTWNHFAVTWDGTTTKIYVNGQLSNTNSFAYSGTTDLSVSEATYTALGYVSNFRVVSSVVYTAAFTPSTSPLTAISGTQLLTCQSNRFIDTSTNALTIAVNGNTSINSFDPFVPNSSYSTYGSGYFDGTGDYLTAPNNAAFNFGTGNFTVECWVYVISFTGSTNVIISTYQDGSNGWTIGITSNVFYGAAAGDTAEVRSSVTPPVNIWTHLALTRSSTTLSLFINGVVAATQSNSTNMSTTSAVTIGTNVGGGALNFTGYITDVRVVKGTAVYTTTFTPPSAPVTAISGTSLLTLQNNQSVNNNVFLDNSSNNFFVTRNGNTTQGTFSPYGGNWSNYFDGSSTAYIQTPAGSTTAIIGGTGAISPTSTFTVECWIYQTQRHTSTTAPCLTGDVGVNGSLYWAFGPDYTGKLAFYHYTGAQVLATGNDTIPLNTWTHIAMSINSGAIKLFVNGNLQTITGATTTGTQNGTFGYLLTGGWYQFGTLAGYYGNLSNLRIVKSALYSTTFTPSTTPLTPITNTGLLMCQSSRFIDNSPNAFALTTGSTLSVQRFSPFNPSSVTPTSYSGYFDGNGDYLNVASNAAFAFGTSDFTLEFWAYPTVNARQDWLDFDSGGGYRLLVYYDGSNIIYYSNGSRITGSAMTLNTWQHIAVVRNSGSTKLYINGSQSGSTYSDSINFLAQQLTIAKDNAGSTYVTGYMSNVRVVKGVAVYTGTFTVPTSPLQSTQSSGANIAAITGTSTSLLTLQSPTVVDNSTNNFTITAVGNSQPTIQNPFGYTSATTNGYTPSTIGGSGYFDGTGDTISVPFSSAISLGTSNFTMEAWCYPTTTTNGIDSIWGSGNYSIMLYHNGTSWTLEVGDGGGNYFTINGTAPIYAWNHMAVTRSGSTFNLWINGVSAGTGTTAGTMKTSGTLVIGGNGNGQNFTGYITDFRLVKGTALYTSSFVPPSLPLTAVQNTSLLTNMTSAGVYDAAMMNNMETVGDAKLSTAISKFGGSSMSFDGTSDYLSTYNPSYSLSVGSGDFTYECWLYVNSLPGTVTAVYHLKNDAALATTVFVLELTSSGAISLSTGTTLVANGTSGKVTTGSWIHFAFVRTSGVFKTFFNGIQDISTANTTTYNGTYLQIGAWRYSGYDNSLNGYLDDIRITKGYARYTANFTPPTSAFQLY